MFAAFGVWCATALAQQGSLFVPPARSYGGVVASQSRLASVAGLNVLDAGGNAMDAAVTTMFAFGVTRPEFCNAGSGGFLVYRGAGGDSAALDFREAAPDPYEFGAGLFAGPLFVFGTGHNVIGVPGVVAGAAAALERYGTKPLAATVAPAEKLARDGVPVTPEQSALMGNEADRMRLYPETARIFLKDGVSPYDPGDLLVQTDYANSLKLIAEQGPKAFYEGPIAKAIVDDMERSGAYPGDRGTMTLKNLADYRAKWRTPVTGTYRGYRFIGMPPPSSGGLASLETLNIVEGYDLGDVGSASADRFHLVAEAQKIAWADRNEYVADPDFVSVPAATMTSKRYAATRRVEISRDRAGTYKPGAGMAGASMAASVDDGRSGETTNIAVIDRRGNAVAINCSIEQTFGSAVVAPGTGILLNNTLTDFDPPGAANEPKPSKRPRSSQSPTIVSYEGEPALVLGGAGSSSVIAAVTNAVIDRVDYGFDVAQAVDAPRVDPRGGCDGDGFQLCVEDGRILPDVLEALAGRGHKLARRGPAQGAPCFSAAGITEPDDPCEYWLGTRVQGVGTDPRTLERLATSDPRNEIGGVDRSHDLGAMGQTSPASRPRLRLSVVPKRTRVGHREHFRFTVTYERYGKLRRAPRATIRFGSKTATTNPRGRARITQRFERRRTLHPRACKRGFSCGRAVVRVRR